MGLILLLLHRISRDEYCMLNTRPRMARSGNQTEEDSLRLAEVALNYTPLVLNI